MSVSNSAGSSNKRPSRSNSITSSVVTIKKSASVSSRGDSKTPYLRNRSTSPDSISRVLHSLNSSRTDFRSRTENLENRKASGGLNVNRWSHSTSSSLSAIDADLIRKRTSSIRRSTGYPANSVNSPSQARTSQDYKADSRASPKRSSSTSNRTSPLPRSRLAFRDSSNFKIVQDLVQPTNTSNPAVVSGSAWEQSSGLNKFGDSVQSLSIHYTTTKQPAVQTTVPTTSNEKDNRTSEKSKTSHGRHRESSSRIKSRDATRSVSALAGNEQPGRQQPVNGETKSPKRRDMLSRALAKANEAVLLDNAQNVNAAIEAYNEACELLQQVMVRSADLADRRKLSSIKATYSKRIAELHDFDNTFVDLMRPLPEDPPTEEYENPEDFYQEDASYQTSAINDAPTIELPLRQESLLPEIFGGDSFIHDRNLPPVPSPLPNSRLNIPMDEQYMPQPLSPRPPPAHNFDDQSFTPTQTASELRILDVQVPSSDLTQMTLVDPSDAQSSYPSSRLSSIEYDRKDGQLLSAIEAEFDAMNAAVDSAYDDEVEQESTPRNVGKSLDHDETNRYDLLAGKYLDNDSEEEERMLEDLTEDNESGEAQFGQQTTSTLPRTSDSSGFSGRTWGSSVASTTATTRTTLSTLAEIIEPPFHAPPTSALPEPPKIPDTEKSSVSSRPESADKHVGIRDRRMSGQSAKQLKIETFTRRNSMAQQTKSQQTASTTQSSEETLEPPKEIPARTLAPAASFTSTFSIPQPLTPMLSVHSGDMTLEESPATPALTQGGSTDDGILLDTSPSRHGRMMPPPQGPITRRPVGSSSLGKGNLSINTEQLDRESPMTPGSFVFPNDARKPQSAVTSAVSSAVSNPGVTVLTSFGLGGMYLFEDHIGDSRSPRSSSNTASEPAPLEPCPDAFLLRPFWLMRCLYQALAHPRGGYISTKLFLPRDIWRVRNIKIKALDDKVAQCDFLTAALQKLAKVDTLDADAVLEELQAFETILEQIRMTLSKKLGSDVGVSGSSSVFKASPATEDSNDPLSSKHGNTSSAAKSIASGWRKLRSKSSSANLNSHTRSDLNAQSLTMASLPMTSSASVATSRSHSNARQHHPPPTPSALPQMVASHAYYVAALARLFDAAQVLDSIARQVEDPGLKCSSQTHVGLELSIRNAAEFFAFYILRFVMSDLLMLLDKFLKKGGEWVMS